MRSSLPFQQLPDYLAMPPISLAEAPLVASVLREVAPELCRCRPPTTHRAIRVIDVEPVPVLTLNSHALPSAAKTSKHGKAGNVAKSQAVELAGVSFDLRRRQHQRGQQRHRSCPCRAATSSIFAAATTPRKSACWNCARPGCRRCHEPRVRVASVTRHDARLARCRSVVRVRQRRRARTRQQGLARDDGARVPLQRDRDRCNRAAPRIRPATAGSIWRSWASASASATCSSNRCSPICSGATGAGLAARSKPSPTTSRSSSRPKRISACGCAPTGSNRWCVCWSICSIRSAGRSPMVRRCACRPSTQAVCRR